MLHHVEDLGSFHQVHLTAVVRLATRMGSQLEAIHDVTDPLGTVFIHKADRLTCTASLCHPPFILSACGWWLLVYPNLTQEG